MRFKRIKFLMYKFILNDLFDLQVMYREYRRKKVKKEFNRT